MSGCRRWPPAILMCLVTTLTVHPCLSVVLHSVAFSLPPRPSMTGSLAPNSLLYDAERLHDKHIPSPHSYVISKDQIFAVTKDNLVVDVGGCHPRIIADLKPTGCHGQAECGALTSIRINPQGLLFVVDAYRGLFQVHPVSGDVHHLFNVSTPVNGRSSVYLNDAAILPDGTILLSDSSSKFGLDDEFWIRFEGRADGRLVAFNPVTGSATEVLTGLAYPNGVELTFDKKSVLVSETGRARIIRVDLTKGQTYPHSVFADNLPGMPENIRKSDRGSYWVGVTYPRFAGSLSPMDEYSMQPLSRNILAKHQTKEQLQRMMSRRGLAIQLNSMGGVIGSLHDSTGRRVSQVTEVTAKDGVMYVGTRDQDAIIRVILPDGPQNQKSPETKLQLIHTRCHISEIQYQTAKQRLKNKQIVNVGRSSSTSTQYRSPNRALYSDPNSFPTKRNNNHGYVQTQTYTRPTMHMRQPQSHPKDPRAQAGETNHGMIVNESGNLELSPWILPGEPSVQYKPLPLHTNPNQKNHDSFPSRITHKYYQPILSMRQPSNAPRALSTQQTLSRHRTVTNTSHRHSKPPLDTMTSASTNKAFLTPIQWRPTISQNLLRQRNYQQNRPTVSQNLLRQRDNQQNQPTGRHRQSPPTPTSIYSDLGSIQNNGHIQTTYLIKSNHDTPTQSNNELKGSHYARLHALINPENKFAHSHSTNSRQNNFQPSQQKLPTPRLLRTSLFHPTPSDNNDHISQSHTTITRPISTSFDKYALINLKLDNPSFDPNASTPAKIPPGNLHSPTTDSPNVDGAANPIPISQHVANEAGLQSNINSIPNRVNTTTTTTANVTITINIQGNHSNHTSTKSPFTESPPQSSSGKKPKRILSLSSFPKSDPNEITLESPGHENTSRNLTKRQTRTQTIGNGSLFSLLKAQSRPLHIERNEKAPPLDPYDFRITPQPPPIKMATNSGRTRNPTVEPDRMTGLQRRLGQLRSRIQKFKSPVKGPSQTNMAQPQLERIRNIVALTRRRNETLPTNLQRYNLVPVQKEANQIRNRILFGNSRARNVPPSQTVSGAARSPLFRGLESARTNVIRKMQSLRTRPRPQTGMTKSADITPKFVEIVSGTGRVVKVPVHPRLLQRILLKQLENLLKSKSKRPL